MDKPLFEKVGKRYRLIGFGFSGFPAEGVWLVKNTDSSLSQRLIMKMGEFTDPTVLIQLEEHREAAVKAVMEGRKQGLSADDLVTAVFKAITAGRQPKEGGMSW